MNNRPKTTQLLAISGFTVTAMIWGFAFVVVKNSLDAIGPTYLLAFRFTIAALVLAVIFHKRLKNLSKPVLLEGAVLGGYLFIAYLLQTVGLQYTTAGKNAFLTTIYVVLVRFLYCILSRKRTGGRCVAAAFLAILGIGLLSLQGDLTMNRGDLLTLICGISFAFHMIYIDKYTEKHDPVTLTVLQLSVTAALSWIMAPFLDGAFPASVFRGDVVVSMLYLGLLSTMVGFLLQNVCQKYTSPSTASLVLSLESVFGVLFSVIFLKEYLTGRMVAGCVLIFGGILLAELDLPFLSFKKKERRML